MFPVDCVKSGCTKFDGKRGPALERKNPEKKRGVPYK